MRRFYGDGLSDAPRIVVLANDALGNFFAVQPLLQMLRHRYPAANIELWAGERVAELAVRDAALSSFHLQYRPPTASVVRELLSEEAPTDWVINVENSAWPMSLASILGSKDDAFITGPSLGTNGRGQFAFEADARGDLWRDTEWTSETLTEKYPFLESGFISEIFCRQCRLAGPIPKAIIARDEPSLEVPDVLIATSASLPEKLWPVEKWLTLVRQLAAEGNSVGLLGAAPAVQNAFWKGGSAEEELLANSPLIDLRGLLTLPQVAGAIAKAKLIVTLDNGIMHLAATTPTQTVALFRHGIHRLWCPPSESVRPVVTMPNQPVAEIRGEAVWGAIAEASSVG